MTGDFISTQNSTFSAKDLVPWVTSNFSVSRPVSCEFYRKGICDTYIVKASKAVYYLKVYFHGRRTRLDVIEEVRLLNYLGKNGVSVAMPIMKKDGNYVASLKAPEGTRYAVLFEEAEGVEEDNDKGRITAFGEMVARFHQCSDKMQGEYRRKHLDMNHLIDDNLAAISPVMARRTGDFRIIENIGEHCKNKVLRLLSTMKPEYGICHGDLFGGDVRYKTDNTPVMFDFDSSGCGWRALDIGIFLATPEWMDTSDKAEKLRQTKLSTFLQGYSIHRKLSKNELFVIQLMPPIRHIFLMGHVLRYNTLYEGNYWVNDNFIDWHMKWFRHWAKKDSSIIK